MRVIENVSIVGRVMGENDVCIVMNEVTGETMRLLNPKGLDLELGLEGVVYYKDQPDAQLVNFETIAEEVLA
jgi:hypothetical protein